MKDRIRNLDEPNRREFLTRTAAASLGVTIFPQLASGADTIQPASTATAKNVIFLYMSGGMTLLPTIKLRLAKPSDVIDLAGIGGLDGITVDGGAVTIGHKPVYEWLPLTQNGHSNKESDWFLPPSK